MVMFGDPYTWSVLFLMWRAEKTHHLELKVFALPIPSSHSLFHFFMFSVSLWSTQIFANSITVWECGVHGCVRVCLLLIKSRANVAAHTKTWQRQENLSICRHGMIMKSHPSDRYWQEQIGLGKQRQLGCARAHLCACIRVHVCEPVYLCGCSRFGMVCRYRRGEKKSSLLSEPERRWRIELSTENAKRSRQLSH